MRILVLSIVAVLAVTALAQTPAGPRKSWPTAPEMKIDVNKTYTATIDTTKGKIVLNLFPKEAPKTVNSFVFLAREKFFDGVIFHRVIPGFMVQTGDPTGTGSGGPGYRFENENQATARTFKMGTVGMANAGANTNGSQFFIMDADTPLPARDYTIFGELKEGQSVVKAIATSPRNPQDRPNTEIKINSVTIEEK